MKIKHYLSLLFFALICTTASAQIQKYSVMVGGAIDGAYYRGTLPTNDPTADELKFTTIEINASPRGGVFLFSQFAVGAGLDYVYGNRLFKEAGIEDEKEVEWNVGPFARYYFPNRVFLEGFVGIGLRNVNDTEKTDVLRGTLGVGYAMFFNDKIALEPMLKYVHYSREITQSIREKRNGLQLGVGLQIYLFHDKVILYR